MKKRAVNLFLALSLLFLIIVFVWIPILFGKQIFFSPIFLQEIQLGKGEIDEEILNYKINLNQESLIEIKKGDYTTLEFEDFTLSVDEGKPSVPEKIYNYYIPNGKKVKDLKINNIQKSEISLTNEIEPGPIPRKCCGKEDFDLNEPRIPDKSIYSKDSLYPLSPLTIETQSSVGGITFIQLKLSSIQYNPVQNKLFFINSVDFDLILENDETKKVYNDIRTSSISPGSRR